MQRTFVRIVWCTLLLFPSLLSLHAEDFWQDTLWTRKVPFGGHFYSKVMFHPDGKSIFTTSDHYLYRYDVQTGNIISTFEMKEKGYIRDYRISRDKQNLILITDIRNNGNIPCFEEWNIDTGYVRHYRYDNIKNTLETISLAMGKNDSLLYVGVESNVGILRIIDYKTGKFIETKSSVGKHIDISSDGKYLVSSYVTDFGTTSVCKLIDMDTWETTAIFSKVYEPKFSPDGRFFAGRNGMTDFLLYDIEEKKGYVLKGHKGEFGNICFTGDSRYLISVDMHEPPSNGGYRVWSTESKKSVYIAPWYFFNASMIAINNEGKNIAAFGNGTIVMNKTPSILVGTNNNLSETDKNTVFSITPNPSNNYIRITLLTNNLSSDFTIVDSRGDIKGIISRNLFTDSPYYDYSTVHLPIGSYTLSVNVGSNRYNSSFIINR